MARTGRPTAKLVLSDAERQTLRRWARRPTSAQALALRAKIVLACVEGATNKDVAAEFSVTAQMVGAISGGPGSWPTGWPGCRTTIAQAGHARSPTPRS